MSNVGAAIQQTSLACLLFIFVVVSENVQNVWMYNRANKHKSPNLNLLKWLSNGCVHYNIYLYTRVSELTGAGEA